MLKWLAPLIPFIGGCSALAEHTANVPPPDAAQAAESVSVWLSMLPSPLQEIARLSVGAILGAWGWRYRDKLRREPPPK